MASAGTMTWIRRHSFVVRIWHWVNVTCVVILLGSGLQIFNAHPRLYWGAAGADGDPALMEIGAFGTIDAPRGVLMVGDHAFDTTGWLGVSTGPGGRTVFQAFPSWATIPSWRDLATGRLWHFFFAWIFVAGLTTYLVAGLMNGHLTRDLAPTRAELAPRHLLAQLWSHMRLNFPKGAEAARYNTLQKLSYLSVVCVLLPMMILTGLGMSPGFDAAAPWLLDVLGGRQSARTLHFASAGLLVLFLFVHLAALAAVGVWNELGSMVTGRYMIEKDPT
jgi:thiosulfate reductase cytochrome b subunit